MKFIDLFSGIGGFRTGMEMNGHECIAFCEIDKFARQSYKAIYDTEGEEEIHDITKWTDEHIREFKRRIGTIDCITGGFPCQSFSIAGKRGGFDDTRGTLFFEIMRIANIIRPRYLFLENVKGLLNHDRGATFETILNTLDEFGYDAEWQVLNSKNFGVPQNRERIFIIGHLRGAGGRTVFPVGGTDGETNIPIKQVAHRKGFANNSKTYSPDGITGTLDTGGGGGRELHVAIQPVFPVGAENKGTNPSTRTVKHAKVVEYDRKNGIGKDLEYAHTLNSSDWRGLNRNQKQNAVICPVLTPDRLNKRQNGRRFKEDGEPMFTLTAQDRHGVALREATKDGNFYTKDNIVVSEEVFYKDPFEYDYEYIEPEFRQIGKYYLLVNQDGSQAEVLIKLKEGVYETVRVIHDSDEIIRLELITAKDGMGRMGEQAIETFINNPCEPGDTINAYNRTVDRSGLSPTLTTRPEGFKTAILPITSELRIRKLTPLECWRLQGFTDEQFYKAKNDGVSNSQLYKQAGNSVTVNVIDAIAKKL